MSFESLFDDSYQRVLATQINSKGFFECFYERFLGSDKAIAARFANTDMNRQQSMLKKSFYSLFTFYASGQADETLCKIAQKHNRKNLDIHPEFYDIWLACLIHTVQQFDPEFSEETELAWRLVLTPGITYMKFKYDKDS